MQKEGIALPLHVCAADTHWNSARLEIAESLGVRTGSNCETIESTDGRHYWAYCRPEKSIFP